ncbi:MULTISPECIES: zinc-binding dehydrogenase [Rhodococcus]|uniref:zinc-binding dehydrogenase n=1 Tax=Rhodococcus TaxID=1827 RepID=UPI00138FECBD|nr:MULTISPECIES: zinc-binding dehydrogenase [Rhodococcus]
MLEIQKREVPDPPPGGLIVRVTMAGVCGTDAHLVRGEVPLPLPIVLGHEGVGVVEELGDGVTTDSAGTPIEIGDRVYWAPMRPCHHCYYCTVEGDLASCDNLGWPVTADIPSASTYGDLAWMDAGSMFYRIPDDTPTEAVIAFGCGLPAAMQGIDRLGGITPRDVVVVQGCGPVGIAATLLAHLAGAREVIVIGAPAHRLEFAKRFGATTTIALDTTTPEGRAAQIRELSGGRGPSVVVEAAGHISAFVEGLDLVARNGRFLVLGLWADQGTYPIAPHHINNRSLKVIGTQFAQPEHYYRTVQLAQQLHSSFPMSEVVTHRYGLDDSRSAIDAVGRGEPLKAVVVP